MALEPPDIYVPPYKELTNEDLTLASKLSVSADGKNTVSGSGVFDDLMEAVNIHLKAQFDSNRIPSSDYGEVYLGSMQSVIQQAAMFLLGRHKGEAEYALILAQIEGQKANILQTYAQILLIEAQTESEIQKRVLYEAQIRNMDADTEIKREQSAADIVLKDMQTQKAQAERDLLGQKGETEKAQSEGISVEDGGNVGGVLGKQMHLYGEQAKAFKWNANQKHLKTLLDAWAVNVNVAGIGDIGVSALTPNGVNVNGCAFTNDTIDKGMNEWIHTFNPENDGVAYDDPGTPTMPDPIPDECA